LGREELESHTSIPVFCEVCESKEHAKQKCPVMKAPKIVVQWGELDMRQMVRAFTRFRMHRSRAPQTIRRQRSPLKESN